MKKLLILLIFISLILSCTSLEKVNIPETKSVNLRNSREDGELNSFDYQTNADIVRLNHLIYYGELLDEYYKRKGRYPLQSKEYETAYVFIANEKQEDNLPDEALPFEHQLISHKEFIRDIESVLKRDVEEYFDPQYEPDYKPNYYIYSVQGDRIYFAVHVGYPYPYAKKVTERYYKIELSNVLESSRGMYTLDYFKNDSEFQNHRRNPIHHVEYFEERQDLFLHYSDSPEYPGE